MKLRLTETTVTLELTADELYRMEDLELAIYGTPNENADGQPIGEAYIAQRPTWRADRCLAFADDFEGYLPGETGDDVYTRTLPRLNGC